MELRFTEVSPTKVAIYIRWSTEDQGEGTTLEVQRDGCRHYVLSQGWQVRDDLIFIDDGYSGATLGRPALTRLRSLVRAGQIECVVVYKLDRLSRSVADTAHLVMEEWDGVCHVRSAKEPIDTSSQAGRMFFYTLVNYAEWERAVIRERTHAGRVRRAQEGRDPGLTVPYGYAKDPVTGGFVTVPHEAAIVRRIFAAYRAGAGLVRLTGLLNAEAVPFKEDRRWQVQTVGYILSNPAYTGALVWGRRTANPRYGKRAGERQRTVREQPLVYKEGVYPPIVTPAEYDEVQAIRRSRPCRRRGGGGRSLNSGYLLTGVLKCALCGGAMVGRHNAPASSRGYYYVCRTRHEQGPQACHAPAIPCHALDDMVVAQLQERIDRAAVRRQCRELLMAEAEKRRAALPAELVAVERQLARLAERERRLAREFTADRFTRDEFRLLRAVNLAEQEKLRNTYFLLSDEGKALSVTEPYGVGFSERVDFQHPWQGLTPVQRKQLLRQFVGVVHASRTETDIACVILWKLPNGAGS